MAYFTGLQRITLGGVELCETVDGVTVGVERFEGMGAPAAVFTAEQRVQADGTWSTTAYAAAHAIGMEGWVSAPTPALAEAAADRVKRAISLAPVPLTIYPAAGPRTITVHRDGDVPINRVQPTWFRWSATMVADDPHWYAGGQDGGGVLTYVTGLPFTSGGLRAPFRAPFYVCGSSSTGDLVISTDAGGRWTWRIDGPVTNPRVIVEFGGSLRTVAWDLTLQADEWLLVDPQDHTSLLQGVASRPPTVRQWPELSPGFQRVQFRADSYHSLARLTVAVQSAV